MARNPNNVRAWRALIDLEADIDARVAAAERVLTLEPFDDDVRSRMDDLYRRQERVYLQKKGWAREQVERAQEYLQRGQSQDALSLLEHVTRAFPDDVHAWRLLAKLRRDDVDGLIEALEQVVRCDPQDNRSRASLTRWRYMRDHPQELAAFYESRGDLERALEIWRRQTLYATTPQEWRTIYRHVRRLDHLRRSAGKQGFPVVEMMRFTLTPLLLYLFLLGLRANLDFAQVSPRMWMAALSVLGGGLLVGLLHGKGGAEGSKRRSSALLRRFLGLVGWGLLLAPFGFLLLPSV